MKWPKYDFAHHALIMLLYIVQQLLTQNLVMSRLGRLDHSLAIPGMCEYFLQANILSLPHHCWWQLTLWHENLLTHEGQCNEGQCNEGQCNEGQCNEVELTKYP